MDEPNNNQNKNKSENEWFSVGIHELRTSLSAIHWTLKMVLENEAGDLNLRQAELLQKSFQSTKRLIAVVNEMLLQSHTGQIGQTIYKADADLEELLHEEVFEFSGECHAKSLKIVFENPISKILPFPFDRNKIKIAIQNLLENAIKYSNPDTIIHISLEKVEDFIHVKIKNTGIGIPEKDVGGIFQKSFRAENAKERDAFGFGLGLYATKKIIEYHGGKIGFISTGPETTFFFSLPLSK